MWHSKGGLKNSMCATFTTLDDGDKLCFNKLGLFLIKSLMRSPQPLTNTSNWLYWNCLIHSFQPLLSIIKWQCLSYFRAFMFQIWKTLVWVLFLSITLIKELCVSELCVWQTKQDNHGLMLNLKSRSPKIKTWQPVFPFSHSRYWEDMKQINLLNRPLPGGGEQGII